MEEQQLQRHHHAHEVRVKVQSVAANHVREHRHKDSEQRGELLALLRGKGGGLCAVARLNRRDEHVDEQGGEVQRAQNVQERVERVAGCSVCQWLKAT